MLKSVNRDHDQQQPQQMADKSYLVSKYHSPRIAVVIPHYNYSEFLGDALLSVQQQTYENFTCVVVDDHSADEHFRLAANLVEGLSDNRFSIIRNTENMGQVHSFYQGLEKTDAAFVSCLDPDDRLAPTFLERMLAVHLSPVIYCPVVCCGQYLLRIGDGITTSTQNDNGTAILNPERAQSERSCFELHGFHRFVGPLESGWHWSTTSSMLYRSDALKTFRPHKKLSYSGQGDSYCAQGAHMLGGTILLNEPLIYRGLHKRNDFIRDSVFSIFLSQAKDTAKFLSDRVKIDVVDAFLANGGMKEINRGKFSAVILAQFPGTQLYDLFELVPAAKELLTAKAHEV